jgi:sec-independent protein translocase protein TatB
MVLPHTVLRAAFSIPDTLFLMVLALVVFGPRRLPEIGRKIGKLMYEFRKASNDFKLQIDEELRAAEEADRQRKLDQERQAALALTASTQVQEPAMPSSAGTASAETVAEKPVSSEPAILPPSTGTQVSAARPDFSTPHETPSEAAPLDAALQSDTPAQVALESGEAAPHHG